MRTHCCILCLMFDALGIVQVTIPENGQSFALIYSIEDPGDPRSPVGGVGVQVMGPDDGYICQFSKDVSPFWASRNTLELGSSFRQRSTRRLREPVSEVRTTCTCCWVCRAAHMLLNATAKLVHSCSICWDKRAWCIVVVFAGTSSTVGQRSARKLR